MTAKNEDSKLTQEQKARIYCIKHGHADYAFQFWGYVYCGRCGEQIGDKLGGVFMGAEKTAMIHCKDNPCKVCDPIIKNLNPFDKTIFKRLKKGKDHEEAIKGIDFGDSK